MLYLAVSLAAFFLTAKTDDTPAAGEPRRLISVVLTARNEENNIRECLESLKNQGWPRDQYEVVIVDDHSTDKTPEIIRVYSDSLENFRSFRLRGGSPGRKKALAFGIEKARGEIIMQIDADCVAGSRWISELSSRLRGGDAIVGGAYLIRENARIAADMQALEFLYMFSIGKSLARTFRTCSLFGGNMAFSKKAYVQAGGYEKMSSDTLLDYQLVRAFHRNRCGRARLIFNLDSAVFTRPMRKLKDNIRQKKRWTSGFFYPMRGWRILVPFLMALYLGVSIYPVFTTSLPLFVMIRLLADIMIMLNPMRHFRQFRFLPYAVLFQFYLVVMVMTVGTTLIVSGNPGRDISRLSDPKPG
jgi:cellulose synthase/poly-beta-1,6-N-acetylglucosamine synthase-like glycosyltransferase